MIRSLFSALGLLVRVLLAFILVAGLVLVAFAGYKGSQPMPQAEANGLTYWQFMRERISAIRELPAKCQQMHFTGYLIAVPVYPVLYTYAGMFPDSFLARHTQPHPAIPKDVRLADAPATWWSLVEIVSWDAWVTPHVPQIMPECNLKTPETTTTK
ncbi:MAG: hypothetical protein QME21_04375 [Anaerolineales bacterium]|nr:hypothetical protein [Anaerolineales bacterium]